MAIILIKLYPTINAEIMKHDVSWPYYVIIIMLYHNILVTSATNNMYMYISINFNFNLGEY